MRKLFPLVLALLLPLVACSGEDNPFAPELDGSLSFVYTGDISGTFAVSGAANFDNNNYPQNAFAAAETASGGVFVAGFRPGQPDSGRTITLTNGQFDVPVRNDL